MALGFALAGVPLQASTTSGLDNRSVTVDDIAEPSGLPMPVFGAVALAMIGARLPKSR